MNLLLDGGLGLLHASPSRGPNVGCRFLRRLRCFLCCLHFSLFSPPSIFFLSLFLYVFLLLPNTIHCCSYIDLGATLSCGHGYRQWYAWHVPEGYGVYHLTRSCHVSSGEQLQDSMGVWQSKLTTRWFLSAYHYASLSLTLIYFSLSTFDFQHPTTSS